MALGVLREYFAGSIEMCVFADASEDVENFPTVRLAYCTPFVARIDNR